MDCIYAPAAHACCFGEVLANNTPTYLYGPITLSATCVVTTIGIGIIGFLSSKSNVDALEQPLNQVIKNPNILEAKIRCAFSTIFTACSFSTLVWTCFYSDCPSWVIPKWNECHPC